MKIGLLLPSAVIVAIAACGRVHQPAAPGVPGPPTPAVDLLNSPPPGPSPPETYAIQKDVPATFPSLLIPTGGLVEAVGSSDVRTVVVSSVSAGAPFDRVHFEWMLEDNGWSNRQTAGGGFGQTGAWTTSTFCRGGDFATLRYRSLPNGVRLVRAAVGKEPSRSCAPGMRPMSDVPIPPIELPGSIKSSFSGSVVSADDTSTRTRLESRFGFDALNAIVLPQLTAAGWSLDGRTMTSRDVSVTRLSGRSRSGDAVTAVLAFVSLDGPGSPIGAMLRFVRVRPVQPGPARRPPVDQFKGSVADEARAMLRAGIGFAAAQTLVDQPNAPEAFPKELLFPESQVAAGAASATTTVVVSVLAPTAQFAPTRFEAALEAAGWSLPQGPSRSGFSALNTGQPTACRGAEFVTFTYRTLASGHRLVRASLGPDIQGRPCVARTRVPLGEIPVPGFELPPGVMRSGGGGTGGQDDAENHTRLEAATSLQTLSDVCSRQMLTAGWKADEPTAMPRATDLRRFTIASASGQPAAAVVLFTGLDETAFVDAVQWVFRAPQPPPGQPSDFSLHINQEIGYAPVTVISFLYGPAMRQASWGDLTTRLRPLDFRVKTSADGQAATGLKLIVYCPGFRFAFLDEPALADGPRHAALDLLPLRTVPIKGRIVLPRDYDPKGMTLEIGYDPGQIAWKYFGTSTGGRDAGVASASVTVATAPIGRDGSFVANVPDFASDGAVSKLEDPGSLAGFTLAGGTAGPPVRLVLAGTPSTSLRGVPIASSYPKPLVLQLEKR